VPAAPAIAPLPGTAAVKTPSAPAVPAPAEGFGQVLQLVCDATNAVTPAAARAPAPASNNANWGQPAAVDADLTAAAIEGAIAGQLPTAGPASPDKGVNTRPATPAAKPDQAGKPDHHAAEPDHKTLGSAIAPAPETLAMPAVVPVNPPPATVPSDTTPVPVSGDPPVPVRATLATTALDTGRPAVQGGVPTTTAKAPIIKGKPDQSASLTPVAATPNPTRPDPTLPDRTRPDQTRPDQTRPDRTLPDRTLPDQTLPDRTLPDRTLPDQTPADQTLPGPTPPNPTRPVPTTAEQAAAVQAQTHPVDAPAPATTNTTPAHPAAVDPSPSTTPVSMTGQDAAIADRLAATGQTPSIPARQASASGEPPAASPNTPSQRVLSGVADAASQSAIPAPRLPLPPVVVAEAGSPAAPPADHKITLRPVEAATDPAKSTVSSASVAEQLAPAVTSATPAAVPATATVAVPHQAQPASPVEQLAPALLTMAKTADGGQQMTVRLHPADLGMVQVRIAQAASGMTQIDITTDNPATLLALQRDQPQLHRTLDDAGIAAAGRTVTFHVAQPAQAAAGGNGSGSPANYGGSQQGSGGQTGSGATGTDGSDSGGGQGSYPARERTYLTGRRSGAQPAIAAATAGQSYRIGLDITA
jgi:flagellar hook-length control protein FliK